ncbi:MAG: hypothetical protein K8W52_08520 [Deltaproteobacteria bacterium]|nr:hypothetical protein [Deltaproteobacteria bacterium]
MNRDGLDGVRQELLAESALSLGLAAERMLAAIAELRAWDAAGRGPGPERAALVDAAGERTWGYVIQREVLGFLDTSAALDVHAVPAEVRERMGVFRRQRSG